MNLKPSYFDKVQADATRRWQQLEADPELAGPWHQLFKQVQSPRHVLSELLQNADDAGATEAKVDIVNDVFVFEHNGEDFTAEHFASLCRFGYSNKRALHTIGFRGIGFKSTFSLGDRVELQTPTLSVFFARERFTLPVWMKRQVHTGKKTQVRVPMRNLELRAQLERNFEEWKRDHMSLLFFKHVRRLRIGEHEVRWESLGPGPAPASEWMALNSDHENPVLLVRSAPIPFPPEAIDEIRQERLLAADEDIELPPTTVDIVLGATGRLYVVLPTGVETTLPFACNAPFVQDPARFKIKEPEVSPTNRWLLRRAGELAATSMVAWLNRTELSVWARRDAYDLLPNPRYGEHTIEDACEQIVAQEFSKATENARILLTHTGGLVRPGKSVAFPSELFDVWPPSILTKQFDTENRVALSHSVSAANVRKLVRWGLIREIRLLDVLKRLEDRRPPKPDSWAKLLALWALVGPEASSYRPRVNLKQIHIMPVEGQNRLFAAHEVSRVGESRLFDTEQDWRFLAQHVLVLDRDWLRFLSAPGEADTETTGQRKPLEIATKMLADANLAVASAAATVVQNAAKRFFASGSRTLADCIRLTQIAAKFKVVGDDIKFVTRDLAPKSVSDHVLVDHWGPLDTLLPADYLDAHLLHPAYSDVYSACSRDEWKQWIESGRSRLNTLPPIVKVFDGRFYSVDKLKRHAKQLSPTWSVNTEHFPYKTGRHYPYQYYQCEDFDFPRDVTEQWDAAASDDLRWRQLAMLLLNAPRFDLEAWANVRLMQSTTNGGNVAQIKGPSIPAAWIRRLQNTDCLPDSRGFYHKPADLMRRTPETESLLDVEPFIDSRLDTEANRRLLDLLGVRSEPTGPEQLLNRVRALTKADAPPLAELEKWYRRLDQMAYAGSTDMMETIKEAFATEELILAEDGSWSAAPHIFISADEANLPGVPTIHARFRDLQLWPKVGVAARPTFERVLGWLKDLPSDEKLTPADLSRVQPLLARYPNEVWHHCGHWLNLVGEWVPISRLTYALTMQPLTPWNHLFLATKHRTADLRRLTAETATQSPFADLALLATAIENRPDTKELALHGAAEVKLWIRDVAHNLKRVHFENLETATRVRALADELSLTTWQVVEKIAMIPYIEGTPVGTSIHTEVIWNRQMFYVTPLNGGRLAKLVPNELGKAFGVPEISRALDSCYDRPTRFIDEYFSENFTLVQAEETHAPREEEEHIPDESALEPVDAELPDIVHAEEDEGDQPDDWQDADTQARDDILTNDATPTDAETVTGKPTGATPEDVLGEPQPHPKPQPPQPVLMERFAAAYGYHKNGDKRFKHVNGSWFEQADGRRPVWEKYHGDGRWLGTYWVKDHCLERAPLKIDAADWALITADPATHQLILVDLNGHPIEVPGTQLLAHVNSGQVTIYPDIYRLEYNHDHP